MMIEKSKLAVAMIVTMTCLIPICVSHGVAPSLNVHTRL
jgi:hypothetical protein